MADLSKFKIALVQMAVGADKAANLRKAVQTVREASENGANIVALPVSWARMIPLSTSTPLFAKCYPRTSLARCVSCADIGTRA